MTRIIHRSEKQEGNSHPNLVGRRFQKGVSGNPKGRPPSAKCIPDMLRAIGDRPPTDHLLAQLRAKYGPETNPSTMREAMLMAAYADAALGDVHARDFIAERTEGKVPVANVNLNANQDTDDLTKMPLAEILHLAKELDQNAG
jgi:hypothetical protein